MNVLLITYDLEAPDSGPGAYEDVIDAIDELGAAVEVQRSVWLVSTSLPAAGAFDHVAQAISRRDRLFVIGVRHGAKWRNPLHDSETVKQILAQASS